MNSILLPTKNANTVPNYNSRSLAVKVLFLTAFVAIAFTTASSQCPLNSAPANTAIWTGETSSDWCNAANWACGKIPDETTNAIIPAGSKNMPVVTCTFSFNAYTANIDVQEGATLTIPSSRTLNITGNFISKDQNRYVLTGRLNFSGADQTIPGFTYNNLTVSGGGIKTLAGDATVNGSLVLTKGILATGNSNLLTLGYKGLVTAGYTTSYIDGSFRRLTNSSRTYNFPVGANGNVRTVLISPEEENEGAYTVKYQPSVVPNNGVFGCTNLMANEEGEFWDISRTNNSSNALVQIDYVNPQNPKSWSNKKNPTESSNVALIQNNKGFWAFNGDASMGLQAIESMPWESNGQLGSKLESDFSHFTFGYGYDVIVPIKILSFTAALQNGASLVSFSLEQGKDVVATELQHSMDEKHFEKLTSVDAGNANVFTYNHTALKAGPHYYRLQLKDKARNISYSKTIVVIVPDYITKIKGLKATLVRYEAFVKIESATTQAVGVNLYDMAGHLVTKIKTALQPGENTVNISTMMITPGIYNMYVQTADGATASLRFMKE